MIARGLGPEGQGRYAFVVATVATSVVVTSLGQFEGNVLSTAGSRASGRLLMVRALLHAATVLAVGVALLFVVDHELEGRAGHDAGVLIVGLVSLETAAQLVRGVNLGQHHVLSYNVATLVQRIALLSGVTALKLVHRLVLPLVLLSWAFGTLLSVTVSSVWIWRRSTPMPLSARLIVTGWTGSFRRGLKAVITITATLFLLRLDWWMLGPMLGLRAVGQVSVATALAEWMWYVPTILGSILFALVAADRSDAIVAKVARASRAAVAGVAPVAVLLIAVGAALVPAIYGAAYREAGRVFVLLVPGVGAIAVHLVVDSYFAGSGFPPVSWLGALGALALKFGLNLVLVPRAGVEGAAMATSLAYLSLLALKLIWLRRERRIPLRELLLPHLSDVREGVAAARLWLRVRAREA